jgi:hypothetical protein
MLRSLLMALTIVLTRPGRSFIGLLVKAGIIALVLNEIRGFILAGPVLYGMYEAGGTWTAFWIGLCSLAGIAVSVVAPLFIARRLKLIPARVA